MFSILCPPSGPVTSHAGWPGCGRTPGLASPNDGVLEVEDTRLAGMADILEVDHTHTFIMNARDTFEACRRFLETGGFRPGEE